MPELFQKPLLGRLPRPDNLSAIPLSPLPTTVTPPPRPVEVHNIELDAADTNLYGNDVWGDCVWVMIEKDRVISAEALGVSITKLTPAQVIKNYCDYTGVYTAPGPGSNILGALKWAQNHPERFGGSKLLFYGDFPITEDAIKEAVAEFSSICVGVVVYQAMEWPAKVWYTGARGANVGGHGIAGGTYTSLYDFLKTWGYMVEVNANGFATIDEIVVCIWDFQWKALSFERQTEVIAAYTYYTGKPWSGPAPVQPITPEVTVPSVIVLFTTPPPRIADSRAINNINTANARLTPGETRSVQVAGMFGIPLTADGIVGTFTIDDPHGEGWGSIGPTPPIPAYLSVSVPQPLTTSGGFTCALSPDGKVFVHNGTNSIADFDICVTGYYIPA